MKIQFIVTFFLITSGNLIGSSNFHFNYQNDFQDFNQKFQTSISLNTTQCKAIATSTKKRCKNDTSYKNGYCRVHGGK